MPPNEEGRPGQGGPHDDSLTGRSVTSTVPPAADIREVVRAAAGLVRTLADQAAREQAADEAGFRDGYVLGYQAGYEVGHRRAEREQIEHERRLHAELVAGALGPSHAELIRRRAVPGGRAYEDTMRRRGGVEYRGGPVGEGA